MFGIGFPEMIVIAVVALLVVGPDKLPSLARSLAKGIFEMKSTMNQLKEQVVGDSGLDKAVSDFRGASQDIKKLLTDGANPPPMGGVQGPDNSKPEGVNSISDFSSVSGAAIDVDPEVIEAIRRKAREEEDAEKVVLPESST